MILEFMLAFIIITSIITVAVKDLKLSILFLSAVSLAASFVFFLLKAPDVAIAEAAIGAGLTVAVFFIALKKRDGNDS